MAKLKSYTTLIDQTSTTFKIAKNIRPNWIETIARDQRLMNGNTYLVGATSSLKAFSAVLETQRVKSRGGISGLYTLQKHMINVSKYNPPVHNASYTKMISSTSDILSRSTPLTIKALNISRLGASECETAASMSPPIVVKISAYVLKFLPFS